MHCREGMMREIYSKLLHGLLQHVAPKPSPPQAPHPLTSQIPNPQILKTAQALQPGMSQAYHEVLKLKHESSCEVLKPRSPLLEPLDSLHSYEIHKHMYTHTYAPNIYIYVFVRNICSPDPPRFPKPACHCYYPPKIAVAPDFSSK